MRPPLLCRNKSPMQISKLLFAFCVPTLCLGPLSIRAADSPPQTPPPAAASLQTTPTKAELKKQAETEAKERKTAEKARKAEQKKQAEAQVKERKEAEARQKPAKTAAAQTSPTPNVEKKSPTLKPIEAPPLPISADKEQRLKELLQKYKTDELSPEQYHQQRAKILAEP